MASEKAGRGGRILSEVLVFLKRGLSNTWRRLLILGRCFVIFFHHLRLRRAWRLLGKRVHLAFEGGEVNPMLAGEVKDSLNAAHALLAQKNRQLQAIALLREKIRASRSREAPPPPGPGAPGETAPPADQEAASAALGEGGPPQP